MQFVDELAAGVVLIRPALQSPDYVAGVSGWAIKVDGTAEFNNVVIRGDGSGDPLVVGPAGLPQVIARTTPTNGLIVFPTNRAIELDAATLNSAVIDPGAAGERAELQLTGPTVDGATKGVRLVLASQPEDGSDVARASFQTRTGDVLFSVDETEIHATRLKFESEFADPDHSTYQTYLVGDSIVRFNVRADGRVQWSSGSAQPDVQIYRDGPNVLATDDTIRIYRGAVTDNALSVRLPGDTSSRLFVNADGGHHWSSGTAASDVSLIRSGPGVLQVVGDLTSRNVQSGVATTPAPGAGGGTTTVAVVFATPMGSVPAVAISPRTTVDPATVTIVGYVDNVTTTGFTVRAYRSTNSSTGWQWVAIAT